MEKTIKNPEKIRLGTSDLVIGLIATVLQKFGDDCGPQGKCIPIRRFVDILFDMKTESFPEALRHVDFTVLDHIISQGHIWGLFGYGDDFPWNKISITKENAQEYLRGVAQDYEDGGKYLLEKLQEMAEDFVRRFGEAERNRKSQIVEENAMAKE